MCPGLRADSAASSCAGVTGEMPAIGSSGLTARAVAGRRVIVTAAAANTAMTIITLEKYFI